MNLHEYQVKKLFSDYSIPIPIGDVCNTPYKAQKIAYKINNHGPWIMKCQVHAGGRGKAGGIKIIYNIKDIYHFSKKWLKKYLITYQTDKKGQLVNKILIEEVIDIHKELYLSVILDYNIQRIVFLASTKGGINIEEITKKCPKLIHKIIIDPLIGAQNYQGRELAFKIKLIGKQIKQFTNIFLKLIKLFLERDLTMIEINPLIINQKGDLICLDGKINVDDNALFRQPEIYKMRDISQKDKYESHAENWKLNYIGFDGNIGCIVNGAGLAMGTMDLIKLYGYKPANFLDINGNTSKEHINEAFKILLSNNKIKVIFINIFGGIVNCNIFAQNIIYIMNKIIVNIPIIIRLEGNNSILGIKKIINSGLNIIISYSIIDAVKKIIKIVENS